MSQWLVLTKKGWGASRPASQLSMPNPVFSGWGRRTHLLWIASEVIVNATSKQKGDFTNLSRACSPQVMASSNKSSLDEPLAGAQEDRVYDRVRQSKNLVGAGRAILDRPQNFPFDRNTKLAMEGWTWTSNFGCFANTFVYGSLPSERVQPQNRSPPRKISTAPVPARSGSMDGLEINYCSPVQDKP